MSFHILAKSLKVWSIANKSQCNLPSIGGHDFINGVFVALLNILNNKYYFSPKCLIPILFLYIAFPFSRPSLAHAQTVDVLNVKKVQHVLILHSYHENLPFTMGEQQGINSVFNPFCQTWLETHVTFMDAKRVSAKDYFVSLKHFYSLRYGGIVFDAIIATDNDALNFLLQYRNEMFPNVPVTFSGINDFDEALIRGHDQYTGVIEVPEYEETIRIALNLFPKATNVVIVSDGTTTGIAHKNETFRIIDKFRNRATFTSLSLADLSMSELLSQLSNIKQQYVVLLLSAFSDNLGQKFTQSESQQLVVKASQGPVFGVVDTRIKDGIIGGKVVSAFNQGKTAAEITLRILNGESPSNIPIVEATSNQYLFDYSVLKHWGIAESKLPKDSIFLNRPVSYFKANKTLLLSSSVVITILSIMVAILIINILRRKQVERSLKISEEQYRTLFNKSSDGIAMLSMDGNIID